MLGCERGKPEETEAAQAVVDAHEDHALAGEVVALVDRRLGAAVDQAAAIDPDHHRQLLRCRLRRSPDVEEQAVLAEVGSDARVAANDALQAVVTDLDRRPHARPGLDRLRRPPTQVAHRRSGERHALEGQDAVCGGALKPAGVDLDDGRRRRGGGVRPGHNCEQQANQRQGGLGHIERPEFDGSSQSDTGIETRGRVLRQPVDGVRAWASRIWSMRSRRCST